MIILSQVMIPWSQIQHFWKTHTNKSFYYYLVIKQICARNQAKLRESKIFSSFLKAQNLHSSSGFVKISASCLSVLTCWSAISPLASWSLKKWCRMSMCFVREWFTGLFAWHSRCHTKVESWLTHIQSPLRFASSKVVGHSKRRPPHTRLRRWTKQRSFAS